MTKGSLLLCRIRRTTASDTEPDDDPDIPQAGTAGAAARRTPRQAAAKRKYADLSESEQEEEEEDSGMEEDDDISSLEIATGSHAKRAKQKQPVHTTSKAAAKGKANQKQGSHSAKHKTSKPALADSDMQNTDEVVLISDNSDTPPSTKPNSRKQVAKASIPQVSTAASLCWFVAINTSCSLLHGSSYTWPIGVVGILLIACCHC